MLKECIEVFQFEMKKSQESGKNLILDSYIPADGTYLIVDKIGEIKANVEIKIDKKTRTIERSSPFFKDICFYDYNSQLISMNKPVDGKKIIHSNSYLSFFVKKDSILSGKLTDEIIDGYYETLSDPVEKKYKKSKGACKIYTLFEAQEGAVKQEEIEKRKQWIKAHIYSLEDVDMNKKDYLKIFFEEDKDIYDREARRYFLPNIYNSNDYNVEIENQVYGLPDNNLGMNAKKPFLSIKTRKYSAPYLLDGIQVMQQKQFFDYLMNLASAGKYNIYIDTDRKKIRAYANGQIPSSVESGYYLRIKKGKEVEIQNQDNIAGYRNDLDTVFDFQDAVRPVYCHHPEYQEKYHFYSKRSELGALINEVFFSNWLAGNFFTDVGDISVKDEYLKQSIVSARERIFNWIYKGIDNGFAEVLEKVSMDLIKGTLLKGARERVVWQLNLRWSIRSYFRRGENKMGEINTNLKKNLARKVFAKEVIPLENDEEYYYAVGQLVSYLLSLSKAKDKNQSLLNPFINAKNDAIIKQKILQIYKKYNYCIPCNAKRVNNMLAMVEGYIPDSEQMVNQEMIVLGYVENSLIYAKEEK